MTAPGRPIAAYKTKHKNHISGRTVAILAAFLLIFGLLYIVLPAIGKFDDTYGVLRHAQSGSVLLAFATIAGTYIVAACTYQLLALHPLRYGRTLLLQVASSFANRILPAGTGGLALNVQYLRKSRHSTAEAGVVAAVNNTLGFVANMLVVAVFLLCNIDGGAHIDISTQALRSVALYAELGALVLIVGLIFVHRFVNLSQYVRPITKSFSFYKRRPHRIIGALLTSVGVCILYTLTLYFVAHSLNVNLTFTQALLAMTLSTVGTVLIPTPGGIGGAEAGVVSALAALHIDPALSLAVALLYRVFTFWIPLIAGGVVFRFSLRYLR
jgi:uncharacterized protein (TIRG00374 family)